MSSKTKLNKISTGLFIGGFFLGKVQSLPIPIISSLSSILSLLFYGSGYSIWFISSHYYSTPASPRQKEWTLPLKNQQIYAAVFGLIATALSIAALSVSTLIIPAAWIFVLSNSLWFFDEYRKIKSPPLGDKNYSHEYQKAYATYAGIINAISIVAALSVTLLALFPLAAIPIFIISGTLAGSLGALSLGVLADHYLNPSPAPTSHNTSSVKMAQSLDVSPKLEEKRVQNPPYQGKNILLSTPIKNEEKPVEDPLPEEPSRCFTNI